MAKTVVGKKMVNGMFDDQLQNTTLSLKGSSLRIGSLVSYMIDGTKLHAGTMACSLWPSRKCVLATRSPPCTVEGQTIVGGNNGYLFLENRR